MKFNFGHAEYKGYFIEYNFYGKGEYSVQYDGDDFMFDSLSEATAFIDDVTAGIAIQDGGGM